MKLPIVALLIVLLTSGLRLSAQGTQALATKSVASNTFGPITNLSIVDGRLFFSSSSMLFSAPLTKQGVGVCDVDLRFSSFGSDVDYVIRHPVSHHLFFTRTNAKGHTTLFECDSAGRPQQLRLDKFPGSICHPVFSSDGLVMVFSSDAPRGRGGFDLWYSLFADGRWLYPVNMGPNVNTPGDERSPSIANNYLYFSSNGRDEASNDEPGPFNIYGTRLISTRTQFGDTAVAFPIGMAFVQQLAAPVTSPSDDLAILVDSTGTRGFWVSQSPFSPDARLHLFMGRPDCVRLQVHVMTALNDGEPSSISVETIEGYPLLSTVTDRSGFCDIMFQPGQRYVVTVSHPQCFSSTFDVVTTRQPSDSLYAHQSYNLFLGGFLPGQDYSYSNLNPSEAIFVSPMSDCISELGRDLMGRLLLFMRENPAVDLHISLLCTPQGTDDTVFCRMLCRSRQEALLGFVQSKLHDAAIQSRIHIRTSEQDDSLDDENNASNATVFRFEERR